MPASNHFNPLSSESSLIGIFYLAIGTNMYPVEDLLLANLLFLVIIKKAVRFT